MASLQKKDCPKRQAIDHQKSTQGPKICATGGLGAEYVFHSASLCSGIAGSIQSIWYDLPYHFNRDLEF
jgi:hypothetical protein